MPDVFTPEKRSAVMAAIRGTGNLGTELRLIALMRAAGLTGWRRGSTLPGRPDFVFRRERVAVFVDGCFWHGCPRHFQRPRTRRSFWDAKIAANQSRDRSVNRELKARGWRVLRIWEHALRPPAAPRTLQRLQKTLHPAAPSAASG